jgi:hypothetical protein
MSSLHNDWNNGLSVYPTWDDDNKAIEVFVTDELVRAAKLSAEETAFDGEQEWPVWFVRFENGMRTELVSIPMWRFA